MFYARDIFFFALILGFLATLSQRVWRRSEALSGLESTVYTTGFMLGSTGFLVWLSGSLVGVGTASIACFFVPCLVVAWWSRKSRRTAKSRGIWRSFSPEEKLLACYLAFVFATTFALTLAPPVGLDYDSLMYHLAAPAQYLRHGRITALPYDHHTFFPLNTEMLFLLGLKLSGPVLAKLFHWLMLPLCCLTLIGVAERHWSQRAGLLGAALFASLPLVQTEATTAYIDLALVAFTLLAFSSLLRWMHDNDGSRSESGRKGDGRWLLQCGVWCGFCLGTKYFGLIPLFWMVVAVVAVMGKRRAWQMKPLLSLIGVALLVGGGWYARNFWWTGNPVFPFAYGIFGGRGWTAPMAADYTASVSAFGFGHSPIDLVWLPWRLSMSPLNVGVNAQGLTFGQPFWPLLGAPVDNGHTGLFEVRGLILNSFLGPALLAFGAPVLLARRKPFALRFIGWSLLFFALVWAFSSQTIRYALPIFALLCWPCGWGLEFYASRSPVLKGVSRLFLVAWLLWTPVLTVWQNRAVLTVVAGIQTPIEYSMRFAPGFKAMQEASQKTPPNSRFAVYAEPRTFYLDRDYFWADAVNNTLIDYNAIHNARDWINALRAQRATHIFINLHPELNAGYGVVPPQLPEALAQGLVREVFRTRRYLVLEIVGALKS
jgi:hypothetical protein